MDRQTHRDRRADRETDTLVDRQRQNKKQKGHRTQCP